MWQRPIRGQIRNAALALLLPALMFRAAIPDGYMPAVDAFGLPAIVMCSSVDVAADRHSPDDSSRGSGPCDFAASTALGPLPESGLSTRLDVPADFAQLHKAVEVPSPAIVRSQFPRGPPHS